MKLLRFLVPRETVNTELSQCKQQGSLTFSSSSNRRSASIYTASLVCSPYQQLLLGFPLNGRGVYSIVGAAYNVKSLLESLRRLSRLVSVTVLDRRIALHQCTLTAALPKPFRLIAVLQGSL